MDLQQMVLEELCVSPSYMKCYRANKKAVESIRGGDDDSYLKLAEYLHCLKENNPGTITDLVTEPCDNVMTASCILFLHLERKSKALESLGFFWFWMVHI